MFIDFKAGAEISGSPEILLSDTSSITTFPKFNEGSDERRFPERINFSRDVGTAKLSGRDSMMLSEKSSSWRYVRLTKQSRIPLTLSPFQ